MDNNGSNTVYSILLILVFFVAGCTKDNQPEPKDQTGVADCSGAVINDNNMVPYTGQEIACQFFLELYHHQGAQFYLLGNHCADMVSYPFDCDGNSLCENGEDAACADFYEDAQFIGIIGVEE